MKTIVALAILSLLNACGNVTEHSSDSTTIFQRSSSLPQGRVSNATIDGNWKTGCVVDVAKRTMYSLQLSFQNNLLLSRTINYADEGCQTPLTEEERLTRIVINSDDATKTTLTETFLTLKYRGLSAISTASLNEKKYCGTDAWVQSQYRFFAAASDCSVSATDLYTIEIYGDQELHLNPCAVGDTGCKIITLQRTSSGI